MLVQQLKESIAKENICYIYKTGLKITFSSLLRAFIMKIFLKAQPW